MKKENDQGDLAPLNPRWTAERWNRMAAAIEEAAGPELARRVLEPQSGLLVLLSGWTKSAFTLAGALAAAIALFLLFERPMAGTEVAGGVADELGYPPALAAWVEVGYAPTPEELLMSMNEEVP